MFELRGDDLIEARMTVDVKIICSSEQMHREKEAHQPEVVVAMQMAYQDVTDSMKVRLVFHQLNLSTFTAVYQEITILDFH